MSKIKIYWVTIMALTGLISLFLLGKLCMGMYGYYRLSGHTAARITKWTVHEQSDSKFYLASDYTFESRGREYSGHHIFKTTIFPNEYAAKDSLPFWETKHWYVWFDAKKPHIASLQKVFPLKPFIHFSLSLLVFLYFFWLRFFILKRYGDVKSS